MKTAPSVTLLVTVELALAAAAVSSYVGILTGPIPAAMDTAVPRSSAPELPPLVRLLAEDRRYKVEAYQFVGAGLEHAQEVLGLGRTGPRPRPRRKSREGKPDTRPVRHVSGQELCLALKDLAQKQYGYMARLVLATWGIRATSDFGEIVYNLIKIGKMSKSDTDRREDFDDVYDFEQAFVKEYAFTQEEEPCRP
jgi:uncharacterized repeat protein (TIGR04138 family)